MNRSLKKDWLPYALIVLIVSFLAILTDHRILPGGGTWNPLELRSIDFRFLLKPKPRRSQARKVVVVAIDEEDYRKLNQPMIFYHTQISEVIRYLVDEGAQTIGLDIELPSISLEEKVAGGYESIYMKSFLEARARGANVIIGFSSSEAAPLPGYLAAAGEENVAAFALTVDSDDDIRRQQLAFDGGGRQFPSFPLALARSAMEPPGPAPGRTILIDYSLSRDIQVRSFYDIYQRSLRRDGRPERSLEGCVVIIGSRLLFQDKHSTPLSLAGRKMTDGVMIQATTLATLLSGRLFREPGIVLGGVLAFLTTLLTVGLCRRRRPVSAGLLCLAETGALLAASILAFNRYDIVRLMPLLSAILLSFIATAVFHYYAEERRRIRIRKRFACFLPDPVIDHIVSAEVEDLTRGEGRRLALLFVDIRGFTSYSERHKSDPQKVVQFLNHYHAEMTDIIFSCDGTVSQLMGDGIFAFFGAPQKSDDPVAAAIRSALRMRARISELKPLWQADGMEDLQVGIGIHYGDAIVGNIGSTKKMDYTAIGDSTNLASRLEGLTKEKRETILISGEAYECVRDRVVARSLGPAAVKGHSDVRLFAVDGWKDEGRGKLGEGLSRLGAGG